MASANYEPIPFIKEAEQIPVQPLDAPNTTSIDNSLFEVYRDQSGHYTIVNTKFGQQRANELDWLMLEQDVTPEVPSSSPVPGTQATGSFLVAVNAAGDGVVGFDFNGVVYAISPAAAAIPSVTAQALVDLVNLGGQMLATLSVDSVLLTVNNVGVAGNVTLLDVTTDTAQTGTPTGMSGGIDEIPGSPGVPEQPAVFSVWTDADFQELYQVVP